MRGRDQGNSFYAEPSVVLLLSATGLAVGRLLSRYSDAKYREAVNQRLILFHKKKEAAGGAVG